LRWYDTDDQGEQLARLTAREARKAPGVPARWSRFLVAHARWILAVTLAAFGAAALLAMSQTPLYKSQAVVEVEPAAVAANNGTGPNMATEEGVVTSWTVLSKVASALRTPITTLQQGVSVSVPGTTSLLQITYSDPTPRVAQQRAQAIAQAYVSYRTPQAQANGTRSTAPTTALVTPASLPTKPSNPNYAIDLAAALIVGLALGIGSAALRDYLDDNLRGPLDVEAQAAAPVLAVIPAFRVGKRQRSDRLVMVTNPDSVVAEAYRNLRTRVVQAATAKGTKTLLVTSPAWEDRSTVAANLSAALAQRGCDVVLQCGDRRRDHAHELFSPESRGGLNKTPAGRASLAEALQLTEVPGLRLLPPGVIPVDPAEQLQGTERRITHSVLERHADFVVVEAPPMLAAPELGQSTDVADMIIIVADARRSTRTQLRLAMREVEHVRDRLAGCVLDNVGRTRYLRSNATAHSMTSPDSEGLNT
jgi:succinoglycan biosynthesis transport protein ExoP